MSFALRLFVPAGLVAGMLACSGGNKPAEDPGVQMAPTPDELVGAKLAEVDGQAVGSVMWEEQIRRRTPASGRSWSEEEKAEILQEAIDQELLFQEAFERGLYHDPKIRKILVNLLVRNEVYEQVRTAEFSEEEMQADFNEHREDFVVPAQAHVLRIFVAAGNQRPLDEARAIAEELRELALTDLQNFRALATDRSDGPFANQGGDLGLLGVEGKPGIPPKLVTLAFALDEGEVSEPFEAAGGMNVVYVPNKRDKIVRTFEQMRGAVMRRMKNEKYERLTEEFVANLRDDARVSVDDAALASFQPTTDDGPAARIATPKQPPHTEPEPGDEAADVPDAIDDAREALSDD